MRRFLRVTSEKAQSFPIVDPLTVSGLQLYLRSDQVAGNQGDPVALWPDLGPNGWHASQAIVANQPKLAVTIDASPNGKRLIKFDGLNPPNNDVMGRTIGAFPDRTNGYTFYAYGRMYAPVNATATNCLFSPFGTGRPQLYQNAGPAVGGPNKLGWRDSFGFFTGGTSLTGLHTVSWRFAPPITTDHAHAGITRQDGGTAVDAIHWTFVAQTGDYIICDNAPVGVGTLAAKIDLGAFVWFTGAHDTSLMGGIERFLVRLFEQ